MNAPSPTIATPETLIGSGATADIHRYGAHALKLYHPGRGKTEAFLEAGILALLETHDLPAPRVHAVGRYDGRWGLVMDRVEGETLGRQARADADAAPAALDDMVRLQLLLHGVIETRLRPLRMRLAVNIARAPGLGEDVRARLRRQLAALPDGDRLCHGDLHPLNIVGVPGRTTVIDWLDATSGPPAADACRSYLLLRLGAPDFAAAYLDRYVRVSAMAAADILAWLPVLAGARLAEKAAGQRETLLELAGST